MIFGCLIIFNYHLLSNYYESDTGLISTLKPGVKDNCTFNDVLIQARIQARVFARTHTHNLSPLT